MRCGRGHTDVGRKEPSPPFHSLALTPLVERVESQIGFRRGRLPEEDDFLGR